MIAGNDLTPHESHRACYVGAASRITLGGGVITLFAPRDDNDNCTIIISQRNFSHDSKSRHPAARISLNTERTRKKVSLSSVMSINITGVCANVLCSVT